jgi:hypothetical protein
MTQYREGFARTREWPSAACEKTRPLITAFRKLDPARKARLRLAMQRLNSAMRRLSPVNVAIDLGIVLETLFLQDTSDQRAELTFRLQVRSARYLVIDPQECRRVYTLVHDLYELRSVAVHTGRVPEKTRKFPVQDVLDQGFGIAADTLRRLIAAEDPDWAQVILS